MVLMPCLAMAVTTPSPANAVTMFSTAVMATTTSMVAPAKMNSTAAKATTPFTTMPVSTSFMAMRATIPSVVQVLIPSMAVMATTPSKVGSSSTVVMVMITRRSPHKQQPSISATETTPLMVPTPHKAKTSTSPLALEMTTSFWVRIIAKQPLEVVPATII